MVFRPRTGTYVIPGGDLSLAVLKDGRVDTPVLRIEILSRDMVAHPKSWKDLDNLFQNDPLGAIATVALMAREGAVPKEASDIEVARSVSNRSDTVGRLVSGERIGLSGNPRDFSQEAWGFYSNPKVPKPIIVAKA